MSYPKLSSGANAPPYYKRVRIFLKFGGWVEGYFAQYEGRPRPIVAGIYTPGRFTAWEPLND